MADAPYGYTKSGRVRKRPLKSRSRAAKTYPVTVMYKAETYNASGSIAKPRGRPKGANKRYPVPVVMYKAETYTKSGRISKTRPRKDAPYGRTKSGRIRKAPLKPRVSRYAKGSAEAKAHMARLRDLRKKK